MESYSYEHFPNRLSTVRVALFTSVKNAAQLRTRIIKASMMEGTDGESERDAVNFAFIEPKLVTSRLHLLTAIYQSMLADVQCDLKTKTVHSEIVWSLNPTNNITEALRRFGVSDLSSSLLVVRVGYPVAGEKVESQMKAVVEGTLESLDKLGTITDWMSVGKYYKLNNVPNVSSHHKGPLERNVITDKLVTSFVAMKSAMS
ncbi:CGI-121-domain-containing protein [Phellopilus nigrolimitatus]|nr:CGI-121-domain-containing protein [Phellopilus nigrolimitatus]